MEIKVHRAGTLTSVQDLGRSGFRAVGVPLGGAVDSLALRVANLLVGNVPGAAALEFTLTGPELEFSADGIIAVAGAEFPGLPGWRPQVVRAGTKLKFGPAQKGCRGYLAVAGGFDVPEVLGSRSTYIRAGAGGYMGRALRPGDVIKTIPTTRKLLAHWRIDDRILPRYSSSPMLRVIPGAQAAEFRAGLEDREYIVGAQSDRMGIRLEGAALERNVATEVASAPVAPGTVQVPSDGQPIVLLADAQTIGGYPQVAHVCTVDISLAAQLRGGDRVRFAPTTLAEAQRHLLERERSLALLEEGLRLKFR